MVTGPFHRNSLELLSMALDFWTQEQGYQFIDLPWLAPERFIAETRPQGAIDVVTPHGVLVASGEQSFLDLAFNKKLPSASGYVGWSPCFRDEPEFDDFHQLGFLKAELFVPTSSSGNWHRSLERIVDQQRGLFMRLANRLRAIDFELTSEEVSEHQLDLLLNGIEVGSYGFRASSFGLEYLYGTALALPRFTQALETGQGFQ